eukprot:TRINITY_DN78753_c0_g1_i1.p1 TRINITY_DN78753_c0_g1~~TRINITY_DN78753_c0_g1_i1.p1  ORF type:complete len:812 (-),score=164.01 TRINITY_DN78753_c0_g1_i1:19-2454(-)
MYQCIKVFLFNLLWQALLVASWNSRATLEHFYSFQEFYTDSQYGPDFGYYSTGRILHEHVSAAGQVAEGDAKVSKGQEFFNSYTTLPMSLSPWFASLLCDRMAGMWRAMGQPAPFFIAEFGGGTGMLARDILRHAQQAHPEFFAALAKYVIGERSQALQGAQKRTAAEFVSSGKFAVLAVDARHASQARAYLVPDGVPLRGFVLSNELLDELDPVRLRLYWPKGTPPSEVRASTCAAYREAYVLHRIDDAALMALLRKTHKANDAWELAVTMRWEGRMLPCGLVDSKALRRLAAEIASGLRPEERAACTPLELCCVPFLLALDATMHVHHTDFPPARPNWSEGAAQAVRQIYSQQLQRTNATTLITKERYREMRRLAASFGSDFERSLLVGGPHLPGRIHSDEVFLALDPKRCQETEGWRARNAQRFAAAAKFRDNTAAAYDGLGVETSTQRLKLVVRPGEAEVAKETGALLDEGFMLTFDYGADADALAWQALVHPNFEGVHTMDARVDFQDECTGVSLACPGLQDLTTSVDFTEFAEAGRLLAGWELQFYGPLFMLEHQSDPWSPSLLAHIIERAGGPRTQGLHSWYRYAQGEQWAAFKALVQHRGQGSGRSWRLGPPGISWPLQATPYFRSSPSSCWTEDLSKPPLAALLAKIATNMTAEAGEEDSATSSMSQVDRDTELLSAAFLDALKSRGKLAEVIEVTHQNQTQAYRDIHLALLLTDYWLYISRRGVKDGQCRRPGSAEDATERVAEVAEIARLRRLRDMHGEDMFDRVLGTLESTVFASSAPVIMHASPFVCLAGKLVENACA